MAMARAGIIWPSFVHKPILSDLQPKHFYSIHLLFLSTPSLKVPNIVPSLVEMIMSASKEPVRTGRGAGTGSDTGSDCG